MLVVRIIFATLVGLLPASVAAEKCVPLHEPIALRLGGFDARGEIERPGAGMPIRGLAVMFAGSDVADLNGTIVDTQDRVVSQPMRQIADRLACAESPLSGITSASSRGRQAWIVLASIA